MTSKTPIDRLLTWQPTAQEIRREGRCDACKHDTLYSYTLPQHSERTGLPSAEREFCGYWCAACGFSNAGSRPAPVEAGQKTDETYYGGMSEVVQTPVEGRIFIRPTDDPDDPEALCRINWNIR